ncbi:MULTISPECIES: DNA polymerase III subunit beta [Microvirgula]|uniref:Beta sliding clamp n=1 Tax=Microvirgula aerodenitrificans TaxID=57480 RepID=A0A2S0P8V4_9NEIS|nr:MULTISPECIES: DNA polymerase III subunit beta [Microvirgula]AVY93798.1 DNA polymerase III subunit beta [Microvirgula aerodenitrificans]RAS14242.1 DNA polymerase III beta subunit [Microvirgula sp. AG722]
MQILQADRDALLKPLQAVTGIVERRHTLPILANVLIEKKGDTLTFLATDLEIQITHASPDSLAGGDFRLTTSAKKFSDILRAIPDHQTVSLDHDDGRLTVKAGKSRFNLQTLPADDFPLLSVSHDAQASLTLAQKEFKALLSQVQYAMAVQDIRYYLNGLLFVTDGNLVKLVATDGHRLAFAQTTVEANLPKAEVILPRKTILELAKLLADNDEEIQIELLANQVRFAFGGTVIISKVVDGKFPDYNRVIPLDNDKIFLIERQAFQQALGRAAILANEKFRGVRIALQTGKMSIQCNNSEQEEAEEELEIGYVGDSLEIGFNIAYLQDALAALHVDTLQLAFGDANRSTLVTIPENPNFKYIVMPMRI